MIFLLLLTILGVLDVAAFNDGHAYCNLIADVGFVLDSSGSVASHFTKEKDFVKELAVAFGVSEHGSRASVIAFSNIATLEIPFQDGTDRRSFNRKVDRLELMGSTTRMDLALGLALSDMFTEGNGARVDTSRVLVLLTDGRQYGSSDARDIGVIADELRQDGVQIIVVAIGTDTDAEEINRIAGSPDMVFTASTFDELIGKEFLNGWNRKICDISMSGKLTKVVKEITAKLDELQQKYDKVRDGRKLITAKLDDLQQEYDKVKDCKNETTAQLDDLLQKYNQVTDDRKEITAKLDDLQQKYDKVKDGKWPAGSYCILANGNCPDGFTQAYGYMKALSLYSGNQNYIKQFRFGSSQIKCHGACGEYGNWIGELTLSTCCK